MTYWVPVFITQILTPTARTSLPSKLQWTALVNSNGRWRCSKRSWFHGPYPPSHSLWHQNMYCPVSSFILGPAPVVELWCCGTSHVSLLSSILIVTQFDSLIEPGNFWALFRLFSLSCEWLKKILSIDRPCRQFCFVIGQTVVLAIFPHHWPSPLNPLFTFWVEQHQ